MDGGRNPHGPARGGRSNPRTGAALSPANLPGPPRLLDSAGLRFALLFAALFATAAVALVAVLWWATAGALDRQTDVAIRADAVALTERWRDAGTTGLAEAIEERLSVDVENEAIYLLIAVADPGGPAERRLAGNLDRWPPEAGSKAGPGERGDDPWFRTRVLHDGAAADARLHRVDLPGLRLLVGRDETERSELRRLLSQGVLWASGAVAIFALSGASLMRHALQIRMQAVFATTAAIAGGDLGARVALSGRGDEFDRLATTMNTMLDRIGTLMDGVRGVSDAIAHDLRTPIARARTKLEEALASAEADDGPALRAAVEQGIADLDGVSRVFQALLRIAEAEAGARRAAFAPLDLVPVLADAAEFYSVAAEARGQRFTTDLPARLDLVGDRDLLLQAVANLLDNAIKFAPAGGSVHLAARVSPPGAAPGATPGAAQRSACASPLGVRQGAPQAGPPDPGAPWVEVTVTDDGPGLALADRTKAGDRFFRTDQARATPGSGLGLSLVRAVASLHGGVILLADAPSAQNPSTEGPSSPDPPGQDPPGQDPPGQTPRGLHVVLRLPRP